MFISIFLLSFRHNNSKSYSLGSNQKRTILTPVVSTELLNVDEIVSLVSVAIKTVLFSHSKL